MKTKKTRLVLFIALLAALVASMALFLTACDKDEDKDGDETFTISWSIPNGTTVTVDGADNIPDTWKKGELTFTVNPPEGYEVTGVRGANEKNGKYTANITKNTSIAITVDKKINSVVVTKNAGAEFVYYAEDELDKSTITVTVNYATGESEVVTDYTVTPATFSDGDDSFTVTYKRGTSDPVALDKAVEARTFGFKTVTLEVIDGKPMYVLKGDYSNFDETRFSNVKFDFQEQGFYSESLGGTQGWGYTRYDAKITEFGNGLFTLRIDMSELATKLTSLNEMLFVPHMGFNASAGDNLNPNVSPDTIEEGQSIMVGGYSYTLHMQAEKDDDGTALPQATTTWDMAGVYVKNVSAPSYKNENISLEVDGGKVLAVINGTFENCDEAQLTEKLVGDLKADYHYNASVTGNENVETTTVELFYEAKTDGETEEENHEKTIFLDIDLENGTYALKFDITGAQDGIMFFHYVPTWSTSQTTNGFNFKCPLTEDTDKLSVTYGGKTYTLQLTQSSASWAQNLTGVKVETQSVQNPDTPDAE